MNCPRHDDDTFDLDQLVDAILRGEALDVVADEPHSDGFLVDLLDPALDEDP